MKNLVEVKLKFKANQLSKRIALKTKRIFETTNLPKLYELNINISEPERWVRDFDSNVILHTLQEPTQLRVESKLYTDSRLDLSLFFAYLFHNPRCLLRNTILYFDDRRLDKILYTKAMRSLEIAYFYEGYFMSSHNRPEFETYMRKIYHEHLDYIRKTL